MQSIAIMSNQIPTLPIGQTSLQSPKPPTLLPSFFPPNSISPAKRERTASTAGNIKDLDVAMRRGGLSPRHVNVPSGITKSIIKDSPNDGTKPNSLFKSAKEASKICLTKSFGSAASKLASLQNKIPNTQPPEDVFFTPPAPPTINKNLSMDARTNLLHQTEVIKNSLKRTGSPNLEGLVSRATTSTTKRRKGDDDEGRTTTSGVVGVNPPVTGSTSVRSTNSKQRDDPKKDNVMVEWRNKYTKAFPNFVFYFDADVSGNVQNRLRDKIKKLGGRIEPFLSNKVTHHITPKGPTATPTPISTTALSQLTKKPTQGLSIPQPLASTQNAKQIVQELKVKVWSVDKLTDVLANLLGYPQPSPARLPNRDISLSTLLEDERLHGTRERDASARRADHYYFAPGNCYLLVEDALSEHRPVMVKEYERARNKDEVPVWPVLYDTFLCPGQTAKANTVPVTDLRERAWKKYVEREDIEYSKGEGGGNLPALLRSESNNSLNVKSESLIPYQAASGNSVVLTSTIASTSNAHMSGGTPNNFLNGGNGAAAYAQGKDKRLIDMSKRVQVLKGNFMRNGGSVSTTPVSVPASVSRSATPSVSPRPPRTQVAVESPIAAQEDVDVDQVIDEDISMETGKNSVSEDTTDGTSGQMNRRVRDRVLEILKRSRFKDNADYIPPNVQRIMQECKMMGFRLQKVKTQREIEAAKKPGYCENCRVKYDSFDNHLRSRKHSKFALNDENFEVLDYLIQRLARPSGHWDTPAAFSYDHASPPADPHTYPLEAELRDVIAPMPAHEAWEEMIEYIELKEISRREQKRCDAEAAGDENFELYR